MVSAVGVGFSSAHFLGIVVLVEVDSVFFVVLEPGSKLEMQIEPLSIKVKLTLTGHGTGIPSLETLDPALQWKVILDGH